MGHKESVADTARVLGRMYDAIEFRGAAHGDVEQLAAHAGVPVYNGLTDEWHPTQMLADFLTMGEASRKPYDAISYCYMGDARSNMGRSLLVMGAIMGSDVRICAPARALAAGRDPADRAASAPSESGASGDADRRSRRRRSAGSTSSTPTCGCRWASRRRSGTSGSACCAPTRSTARRWRRPATPRAKFMHCLPAYHDRNTVVGREIMDETGMDDGLEVTDDVFESPAASCSTRPRTACTRSRPCSSPPSDRRDDDVVSRRRLRDRSATPLPRPADRAHAAQEASGDPRGLLDARRHPVPAERARPHAAPGRATGPVT